MDPSYSKKSKKELYNEITDLKVKIIMMANQLASLHKLKQPRFN